MAPYPSGKGAVCKTVMHQFDSDWCLRKLVHLSQLFLFNPGFDNFYRTVAFFFA